VRRVFSSVSTRPTQGVELGRQLHGLSGLVGGVGAMPGQISAMDGLMRESQRTLAEAM
jgi:hypothetical protein